MPLRHWNRPALQCCAKDATQRENVMFALLTICHIKLRPYCSWPRQSHRGSPLCGHTIGSGCNRHRWHTLAVHTQGNLKDWDITGAMHCMQINLTALLHSFYSVNALANAEDKRQWLYAAHLTTAPSTQFFTQLWDYGSVYCRVDRVGTIMA